MTRNTHTRLQVASLENRLAPALLLDLNGAGQLTRIREAPSGQTDAAILSVSPGNLMTVQEGAMNYGTFRVAKSLSISLGNGAAGLVNRLNLNDNLLQTNLNVDLGNQPIGPPTQFRILGGTTGLATIDGNINVQAGSGSQFFLFGDLGAAVPHFTHVTGSMTIDMGQGGEGPPEAVGTVGVPPLPSRADVDGNVVVQNSTIFVWAGRIGGHLTVDSTKPADQLVILGNFNRPISVGGNVSVRTGDGIDEVDLQSALCLRNVVVDTEGGSDLLNFGIGENNPGDPGFNDAPATILGNLVVSLGGDSDVANFGANSLTHPGQTNPFTLGGKLSVDAGDGDDSLSVFDLRVQGRDIVLDAGAGNDTVTVAKLIAPQSRLFVELGSGDDTFCFADHSTVSLSRAVIDGGDGDDIYQPGIGNMFDFPIDWYSM